MILSSYGTDSRPMSEQLSHHISEAKRATAGHSGESFMDRNLSRRRFLQGTSGIIYLPGVLKGIDRPSNPNPVSTPTPTELPTPEPTPTETETPKEILFDLGGETVVTVGSADPFNTSGRIIDDPSLNYSPSLAVNASANGDTGWIMHNETPVAYRVVVPEYAEKLPDNQYREQYYLEIRADQIPHELRAQLPSPEEHRYEGERDLIRTELLRNASIASPDTDPAILAEQGLSPQKVREIRETGTDFNVLLPTLDPDVVVTSRKPERHIVTPEDQTRRDMIGQIGLALSGLFVGRSEKTDQDDKPNRGSMSPVPSLPPHGDIIAPSMLHGKNEAPLEDPFGIEFEIDGPPEGFRGVNFGHWEEGTDYGNSIGVIYTDGKLFYVDGHARRANIQELHLQNLDRTSLRGQLTLGADKKTVEITITDGTGEIITFETQLGWTVDGSYPLQTSVYCDVDSAQQTQVTSLRTVITPSTERLANVLRSQDPSDTEAQNDPTIQADARMAKRTSRPKGRIQADGYPTVTQTLGWYDRRAADTQLLNADTVDHNKTIVIDRGTLYGNQNENPDSRGRDFWHARTKRTDLINPYNDELLLTELRRNGSEAVYVTDVRVLDEPDGDFSSPVDKLAKKSELMSMFTALSRSRKGEIRDENNEVVRPADPMRIAVHGMLGTDGNIGEAMSKIGRLQSLGAELVNTLPQVKEGETLQADYIPMMSRDTVFNEDTIANMKRSIIVLNQTPGVHMDRVMVSTASTAGEITDSLHLEQLRQLTIEFAKQGIAVDYTDVGAGGITFAQVMELKNLARSINPDINNKLILTEPMNVARNNVNAAPLFVADNRGKLTRTSAHDDAVKLAAA